MWNSKKLYFKFSLIIIMGTERGSPVVGASRHVPKRACHEHTAHPGLRWSRQGLWSPGCSGGMWLWGVLVMVGKRWSSVARSLVTSTDGVHWLGIWWVGYAGIKSMKMSSRTAMEWGCRRYYVPTPQTVIFSTRDMGQSGHRTSPYPLQQGMLQCWLLSYRRKFLGVLFLNKTKPHQK